MNFLDFQLIYILPHRVTLDTTSLQGCGFVEEIGRGDGRGFNIPFPLDYRSSEADLEIIFDQLIVPIVFQFKPEFIAISIGFDAYERDPIGILGVTADGFSTIGSMLQRISSELNIPFANFLEGGYNIQMLPKLLSSYSSPLIYPDQTFPKSSKHMEPNNQTIQTLNQSKKILSDYWEL